MFDDSFQVIFVSVFILFAIAGVIVFATGGISFGDDSENFSASFSVWGTLEEETFNDILEESSYTGREAPLTVDYTQVDSSDLENRLVNALARDSSPDAVLLPHNRLVQIQEFLTNIGPDFYPLRQFRNQFVEAGEIFVTPEGVVGLPFAIDPLVMYWNRDIFSNAGFVSPPEVWSDLPEYARVITRSDNADNINQSAVALGTADNIESSKEIISSLLLQAGNSIVTRSSDGYDSQLNSDVSGQVSRPADAALRLYTQYANPATETYSWNSSFSSARQAFISNQVGMYFDLGSEISNLRARNPNLNLDVAPLPQAEGSNQRNFGIVYGFAILQEAPRKDVLLQALNLLTNEQTAQAVSRASNLTPAHKTVVAQGNPANPYKSVFFEVAPTTRGWLDPNPERTEEIFAELIRDIISGRRRVGQAVNQAEMKMNDLLGNL